MTINLEEMDPATLKGSSECYGKVNLDMQAFRKLTFNLYEEEVGIDSGDDWD